MKFLKPTKFKVIFTLVMILVGAEIIGAIFFNGVSSNSFGIFNNAYLGAMEECSPSKICLDIISSPCGGDLDVSCFWTKLLEILITQIVVYYLLACLIETIIEKFQK